MKKALSLILASLMVLSLAACGTKAETPAPAPSDPAPAEQSGETADYPTKTIEIACPYGAGGGQDVWSRITANYMMKYMGEGANIIVNNVTGGGGVTGATYMANSENSGYYLGSIVPWQLTDQFVQNDIPYDETSFEPVGVGSYDCNFIVVSPKLGVSTWEEFAELIKSHDGEITMAMGGNWNVHDFLRLKVEDYLGASFARMSYDGGASALAAVMTGDAQCASLSIFEALSAMETGDVIAICVTSEERSETAPDVPSLKELGVDIVHGQWRALTVPPGTDPAIKAYLSDILNQVFSDAEYIPECKVAGLDPVNYTGEAAEKYVSDDFAALKDLVDAFGITPDYEL
ncbi:Bug family tripartite tricarboxylate transporter substrate binding protein [Dysosmobacter sp.]